MPDTLMPDGSRRRFDDPADLTSDDEWWNEDDDSTQPAASTSRITQWPTYGSDPARGVAKSRKASKRYSVQKPIREKSKGRQKKQNALAGIKVITNFSRTGAPVAGSPLRSRLQRPQPRGAFVDLAALRALTGGETQTPIDSVRRGATEDSALTPATTKPAGQKLKPPPLRLGDDLSPSDRPIVIGISIPSASLSQHAISPTTAGDATKSPAEIGPSPTIVITRAQEKSIWSPDSDDATTPARGLRPTSSIYSRATNCHTPHFPTHDMPPVPRIPSGLLKNMNGPDSPQSPASTIHGNEHETTRRDSAIMSASTIFEDETPILEKALTATPVIGGLHRINTDLTRPRSKGWWTYIVSPFITRSNTFAAMPSPTTRAPPLPSLAAAAAKAQEDQPKNWEKQFSPLTPGTATTSSSAWWNQETPKGASNRPRGRESSSTVPFMITPGGLGGATILERNEEQPGTYDASIDKWPHNGVDRNGTVKSVMSPNDRDVPMVFDNVSSNALQSNNPFQQQIRDAAATRAVDPITETETEAVATSTAAAPVSRAVISDPTENNGPPSVSLPPPYSPPRVQLRQQRPFVPAESNLRYPPSPGPFSPGLQNAMTTRGEIPMSEVPLTPAVSEPRRVINLNSGYSGLPPRPSPVFVSQADFAPPPEMQRKAEKQRRRYEKEDKVARKVGGLWRGRGCIPDRGCFGRGGAEGRKKRRVYFWLIAFFVTVTILSVALATTITQKSSAVIEPSQWLNLTGFPPIYTGVSTVAAPENTIADTACVDTATMWSCALPKELQQSVAPNAPNQPNFRFHIQWDNSSAANATFANVTGNSSLVTRSSVGNAVSAGHFIRYMLRKARSIVMFIPSPAPPSWSEEFFLGNTTDDIVSSDKAGEPTPFFMTLMDTSGTVQSSTKLRKRDDSNDTSTSFPNITAEIPPPDENSDGTAAPANLLPFFTQQPIRLYDRGLDTEHYGFYNYFDRAIFLTSALTAADDGNGGAAESEAAFRCTWSETRFLVQMWTRRNTTAALLNSTSPAALVAASTGNTTFSANDFVAPGSFPYPVTVTLDRHGGDPDKKGLYCYTMDSQQKIIAGSGKLELENRAAGGTRINPAPNPFDPAANTNNTAGGFDGGTGGCRCAWQNFVNLHQGV